MKNTYKIYSSHLSDNDNDNAKAAENIATYLRALYPDLDVVIVPRVSGYGEGLVFEDVDFSAEIEARLERFDAWVGV